MPDAIQNYLRAVQGPEQQWDLFGISLEICRILTPDLDVQPHQDYVGQLVHQVGDGCGGRADPYETLDQLNRILFGEQGFRGNSEDYYNPRNSYMCCVLEDRKGIPITLSILYRELAVRLGLQLLPVNMPGHFLLRLETSAQPLFIDAFNRGEFLLEQDCRKRFSQLNAEAEFRRPFLEPAGNSAVVMRVLTNLKQIYRQHGNLRRLLKVINRRIPLYSDSLPEILERGLICLELKRYGAALKDFETFIAHARDSDMKELIAKQLTRLRALARAH